MSNVLTDWREALMAQIRANLQAGAFAGDATVAGEIDNGPQDRNLCCVFAPTVATDTANVSFARPVMVVRAWIPNPKTLIKTVPQDPAPVEQLMIDLAVCLQATQTLPDVGIGGLYYFLTQIKPDYPDYGVEATLRGWTGNPGTLPEG